MGVLLMSAVLEVKYFIDRAMVTRDRLWATICADWAPQ